MPKNIIVAVAVAAIAFFAGLSFSWLIGQRIVDRAMDDSLRHMTWEPEGRVRVSVITLKLLQRGDVAEAIRINCNMARSSLPY